MANSLTTNPIVIDNFGADVVISERAPLHVKSVIFSSTQPGDKLLIEDRLGVPCIYAATSVANETVVEDLCHTFQNGLVLDVSDGTYIGVSKALIYLE